MKTTLFTSVAASLLVTVFLPGAASAQNVGVGTSTPKSKFSVNGTTASGGIAVGDASYTSTTGTIAPLNGAMFQGSVLAGRTATRQIYGGDAKFDATGGSVVIDLPSATGVPNSYGYYFGSPGEGLEASLGLLPSATGHFLTMKSFAYLGFIADSNNTDAGTFIWAAHGADFDDPLTTEYMRLTAGNLGIGDTSPTEARLVVRGGVSGSGGAGKAFNEASVNLGNQPAFSPLISIFASNVIAAGSNVVANGSVIAASSLTPSDSRLKNIVGPSNAAADLQTLQKLRITDYTMKDRTFTGNRVIKKVIAQQVEEVYPEAISKTCGYLPDIQSSGVITAKDGGVFTIRMDAPHPLEAGTKVKLLLPNGEPEFVTVETVRDKEFTAKSKLAANGDKVFVYGRQVEDLRAVDYDALSMLNISATQELAKEVAELKAENAQIKAANDKLAGMAAEMETLKKTVAAMQPKGGQTARTVALDQ